jgi:predicted dehydrogenase
MVDGPPGDRVNALVVGYGSIGRRHVANLLDRRDVAKVTVVSRRTCNLTASERRNGRLIFVKGPRLPRADFALICNETRLHARTATLLANRGVPLFIEKPLAHRSSVVERLRVAVHRSRAPVFVAYNLRFLGALRLLKKIVEEGTLGQLYAARLEAGQWLPDWRPGRDWRQTYSANRSQGGGVALDLSHEIDSMRWLFGEPVSWKTEKANTGRLTRGTEDVFGGLYRFRRGFLCSVHLDYLQKSPRRQIRVVGTLGSVHVDLIGRQFVIQRGGREIVRRAPALFDVAGTYADELDYFIQSVRRGGKLVPGLEDGARVLTLIDV